jgi:hypothetical protein
VRNNQLFRYSPILGFTSHFILRLSTGTVYSAQLTISPTRARYNVGVIVLSHTCVAKRGTTGIESH